MKHIVHEEFYSRFFFYYNADHPIPAGRVKIIFKNFNMMIKNEK